MKVPRQNLNLLVLGVLRHQSRHGYGIAKEIRGRSDGILDFKAGSLYPALYSLENAGLISGEDQLEDRRLVRYYSLTENGHREFEKQVLTWKQQTRAAVEILGGLDNVLG